MLVSSGMEFGLKQQEPLFDGLLNRWNSEVGKHLWTGKTGQAIGCPGEFPLVPCIEYAL
jgi:hypothetical protein